MNERIDDRVHLLADPADMPEADMPEIDGATEFALDEGELEFDTDGEDAESNEPELDREAESGAPLLPAAPVGAVNDAPAQGSAPQVAAAVTALQPPAPPRPLRLKLDKWMIYQQLPTFADFQRQAVRFGPFLRLRYDETRVSPELQGLLATYPDLLRIVALVTEDDPDTLTVAPVVARLCADGARWDLRFLRDDDPTPLTRLLPELDLAAALEEWDLPQFLLFDEDWELVAQWGPRPAAAEAQLEKWLAAHPEYETLGEEEPPLAQRHATVWWEELVYTMRAWYNSGLTKACLDEWRDLIVNLLQPSEEPESDSQSS